jgi:hypothetical protein
MSFKGKVKNGVVVLPPEANLSEGAEVEVVPAKVRPEDDPFLTAARKVAKPRPHWPRNYARELDDHLYGVSRKP